MRRRDIRKANPHITDAYNFYTYSQIEWLDAVIVSLEWVFGYRRHLAVAIARGGVRDAREYEGHANAAADAALTLLLPCDK